MSPAYVTPLEDLYGKAANDMGYKTVDCNGEDMIGKIISFGLSISFYECT